MHEDREYAEEAARNNYAMLSSAANLFDNVRVPAFPAMDPPNPTAILNDALDRLATQMPTPPPNPIYETNSRLDQIIVRSEILLAAHLDLTKTHQGLNDTTFAMLSEMKGTSKQTSIIIVLTAVILILTAFNIWLAAGSNNDLTATHREMMEGLASRHAAERSAMLAEQGQLIEQLAMTTQALIQQQAGGQRAAIQELQDVLSQKEAPS